MPTFIAERSHTPDQTAPICENTIVRAPQATVPPRCRLEQLYYLPNGRPPALLAAERNAIVLEGVHTFNSAGVTLCNLGA
jgi:hypothetical protein